MDKKRLILGSAGKSHPDAVTVDIDPRHGPDVVCDLNSPLWPFADNQFEAIICHHVLEHLNDLAPAMKELHRICRAAGSVLIEVPHFSSWMANDPAHKLRFSYFSIDPYISTAPASWQLTDLKFLNLEHRLTFHRAFRRYGLQRLWNRFPMTYERFWTYVMPAEHLVWRLQPLKNEPHL